MEKLIPNSTLRQILFIIVSIVLLLVVFANLWQFFPGVLGAFCLYVLMVHPLRWMTIKWKMNRLLAVLLLMIGSFAIIITPLFFLINMLTAKVGVAIKNKAEIQDKIEKGLEQINQEFGVDLLKEINLGDLTAWIVKIIQEILNTSLNGLIQIGVAYLILYFMLMNYKKMEHWFYKNIPLKTENLTILNKDLRDLVISNAVGIPLVAFFQALVAYVGYIIFGLEDPFSWFLITFFGAMLPVVGAAIVYVPASLYLLAAGDTANGYLLLAYGFIVVGLTDNILRFWLQKVMADVHPLITIFGVILGVNIFGFIGIIFGPIFISLTIWMFRIYKLEFTNELDEEEKSKESSAV